MFTGYWIVFFEFEFSGFGPRILLRNIVEAGIGATDQLD
jgi:hypothetical protein